MKKIIPLEPKVGLNSNQALNLNSYKIYTFVLREETVYNLEFNNYKIFTLTLTVLFWLNSPIKSDSPITY